MRYVRQHSRLVPRPPLGRAFYGGEAGVERRLARAVEALAKYARTRELVIAPAYEDGNERAGMRFPLDYYAPPATESS